MHRACNQPVATVHTLTHRYLRASTAYISRTERIRTADNRCVVRVLAYYTYIYYYYPMLCRLVAAVSVRLVTQYYDKAGVTGLKVNIVVSRLLPALNDIVVRNICSQSHP